MRKRYYVLFLIPVFIVQVTKLVQFTFENSTVNINALCNLCEDMACCSSVQWNNSISETVRSRTHVDYTHFCLKWPILWPPRILTFLPGIHCRIPVIPTLFRPLSEIRPNDHKRPSVGQLMITAIRRSSKQLREFRALLEAFQSFWVPEEVCKGTMSRSHKQHAVRSPGSCRIIGGSTFFLSQQNVRGALTQCYLVIIPV
jgi:hypothetical protein